MCITTSPQPVSATSSSIAVSAPLMSLIATAPAASAWRATSGENVSAETGTPTFSTSPSIAGTSRPASSSAATGGPLRAATAPMSSISKPASTRRKPSRTACSGVSLRAPSKKESSVTLTIPTPTGRSSPRVRSLSCQILATPLLNGLLLAEHPRLYGSPVSLRCVYTDLDGTLLGRYGSLFRDSEGEFSMLQARALETCDRAGVEVVIKSGRRESSVMEDAKLIGSRSYMCEVRAALVHDGERT